MFAELFLASALLYFVYRIFGRTSNFPPGPTGLPVVGYLPFLDRAVHEHMTKLSEKYGDIFGLKLGSYRVVIFNSLSTIRDAFKEDVFTGRPDFQFINIFSDNKKGIMFSEGQTWQDVRRFTLRNLRDFGLGKSSIEGLIQCEIKELINSLSSQAGTPVNLAHRFNLAAVNALWTITAGTRFSQNDPQAIESIIKMNEILKIFQTASPVDVMPFLTKFRPWKNLMNHRFNLLAPMLKLVSDSMNKQMKGHTVGDESDLVHAFIDRMNNNEDPDSPFGKDGHLNLKNLLVDLYVAGTKTVSATLLWLILLLTTYPDIQEKVQQEIDSHVPRDQLPSMEHRSQLVYTEATIRESMRYATLGPLAVPHCALADREFRGYTIPKGTILFANVYKIHRSPEYWEKPEDFYPEHFINEDGSLKNPEAFLPFSIGKRMCLGDSLAKMELYLFTTALLQKFKFKFPADRPPPSLIPDVSTILVSKPFDVVIELRN